MDNNLLRNLITQTENLIKSSHAQTDQLNQLLENLKKASEEALDKDTEDVTNTTTTTDKEENETNESKIKVIVDMLYKNTNFNHSSLIGKFALFPMPTFYGTGALVVSPTIAVQKELADCLDNLKLKDVDLKYLPVNVVGENIIYKAEIGADQADYLFIYNANKALDDIENRVEQWHNVDTNLSVHEYLGMTEEEYSLWVQNADSQKKVHSHYILPVNIKYLAKSKYVATGKCVAAGVADSVENVIYNILYMNKCLFPLSFILPKVFWKATKAGMRCKDTSYELGKLYIWNGEIKLHKQGYHFATNTETLRNWYSDKENLEFYQIQVKDFYCGTNGVAVGKDLLFVAPLEIE